MKGGAAVPNTRKGRKSRFAKHFEPELANRMLPLVKAVTADIVRQWVVVRDLNERLGMLPDDDESPSVYRDEVRQERRHQREELRRLRGYIEELTHLGLEARDSSRGIVHFPARIDGEDAYLCWKLGEEEVLHWHERSGDCSTRRSLAAGSATEPHAHDGPSAQDDSFSE